MVIQAKDKLKIGPTYSKEPTFTDSMFQSPLHLILPTMSDSTPYLNSEYSPTNTTILWYNHRIMKQTWKISDV